MRACVCVCVCVCVRARVCDCFSCTQHTYLNWPSGHNHPSDYFASTGSIAPLPQCFHATAPMGSRGCLPPPPPPPPPSLRSPSPSEMLGLPFDFPISILPIRKKKKGGGGGGGPGGNLQKILKLFSFVKKIFFVFLSGVFVFVLFCF